MTEKKDQTTGAQTNPRRTNGEPPAPPPAAASTGTSELNIPTLAGAKPTNADKPASDTGTAPPEQEKNQQTSPAAASPDAAQTGLSDNDRTEIATIAARAASEVMERFFERMAKNNPASIRQSFDAESTAPDRTFDIPVDGDLGQVKRSDLDIAKADMGSFESHAAEMAFMMEPVTIVVAETTDPNEQQIFGPLGINGRQVWIERGKETTLPRCFVEQLYRARPQRKRVSVAKTLDGDVVNRVTSSSALKYPFSIIKDVNPRGRAWAKKLQQEG